MLAYFISRDTLSILDCLEVGSHTFTYDIDCGGKSSIVIARKPQAATKGDFVHIKDGNNKIFSGVIESINNANNAASHTINLLEMENIFDRQILLTNTDLIASTGLEDFIKKTIEDYFSASGDAFIDLSYININVLTHTKINAKPANENGIYNFKTYLGNVKQYYGVFLTFEIKQATLEITIEKRNQSVMNIDSTVTDFITYAETYQINALSKLTVNWLNTTSNVKTIRNFYLHSNKSISEDPGDRVAGTITSAYIEAATEAEMLQNVYDQFKGNSYAHSIEAVISINSKIYPVNELYVGHTVRIRTGSAGVQDSIISEISRSNSSETLRVKFGILKISLTEKIKKGVNKWALEV